MPPHYSQPYANSIFLFLLDRHVLFMYLWTYVWIQHERMRALGQKLCFQYSKVYSSTAADWSSITTDRKSRKINWFINPKSPCRLIWLNGTGEFEFWVEPQKHYPHPHPSYRSLPLAWTFTQQTVKTANTFQPVILACLVIYFVYLALSFFKANAHHFIDTTRVGFNELKTPGMHTTHARTSTSAVGQATLWTGANYKVDLPNEREKKRVSSSSMYIHSIIHYFDLIFGFMFYPQPLS
jgi:hypothetical protein